MIAIVMPTRGIIFTEVEQAIEKMRLAYDIYVYRSSGLKIPDGVNQLTEKALEKNPSHIFYIEEDTVPPPLALNNLLAIDADVAFIDYAVNGWACSAVYPDGEILWCGLGCTLVKADVFKKLKKPYFRTDKSLSLNDTSYFQWKDIPNKYGGHDIWFFTQVREVGFTILKVPGECKHLKLEIIGLTENNNGCHLIKEKSKIKEQAIWKKPVDKTRAKS